MLESHTARTVSTTPDSDCDPGPIIGFEYQEYFDLPSFLRALQKYGPIVVSEEIQAQLTRDKQATPAIQTVH